MQQLVQNVEMKKIITTKFVVIANKIRKKNDEY